MSLKSVRDNFVKKCKEYLPKQVTDNAADIAAFGVGVGITLYLNWQFDLVQKSIELMGDGH